LLNPKSRTYLGWLGVVGTFVSCFGCGLAFNNQMSAARAFLILAWLILVPLFFYLVVMRSRASAEYKRRLRKREAQVQRELEALATVEGILQAGGVREQGPGGAETGDAHSPQPPAPST
jgi:hypothetical protein